jgi:hypothetical protein
MLGRAKSLERKGLSQHEFHVVELSGMVLNLVLFLPQTLLLHIYPMVLACFKKFPTFFRSLQHQAIVM